MKELLEDYLNWLLGGNPIKEVLWWYTVSEQGIMRYVVDYKWETNVGYKRDTRILKLDDLLEFIYNKTKKENEDS